MVLPESRSSRFRTVAWHIFPAASHRAVEPEHAVATEDARSSKRARTARGGVAGTVARALIWWSPFHDGETVSAGPNLGVGRGDDSPGDRGTRTPGRTRETGQFAKQPHRKL